MDLILRGYDVNQATWFYLSLLLIIAVFFRFYRVWSLRNVDLVLLLVMAPGLIFVEAPGTRILGFSWLFAATGLVLLRMLLDPLFVRRPHFEQNLNPAGLTFLCVCAFALMSVRAVMDQLPASTEQTMQRVDALLTRTDTSDDPPVSNGGKKPEVIGPAAPLLAAPVHLMFDDHSRSQAAGIAARILAILSHFAVIMGLIFVSRNLFCDQKLGIAMATLYLLLPCTAYDVGEVIHVLPAALIVWAFATFRRPIVSGGLLGLACGTLFFPVFLLPLWVSFYGRRKAIHFVSALLIVTAVLLGSLAFTSADPDSFRRQTLGTIDLARLAMTSNHSASGFWEKSELLSFYRTPVIAAFGVMLIGMTIWPRRKTVEHLVAYSTAIIVALQFWYPQEGGIYLLWYLPLWLMVVFRPRLAKLTATDDDVNTQRSQRSPGANGQGAASGTSKVQPTALFR